MREVAVRLRALMSMPRYLMGIVVIFVISTAILVRVFEAQANTLVSATVTGLCACVGLLAIVIFRRWSARLAAGDTALIWFRSHLWPVGMALIIGAGSLVIGRLTFSYPLLPLIGLSLLVVGTQLLLRAFLLEYFLRFTGNDKVGIGVAIVFNALILTACALRGDQPLLGWFLIEVAVNYLYYYTAPALLPVLIFFGAALAVPDSDGTLMAGLVAMATYYAVMIVSRWLSRPAVDPLPEKSS